MSATATDTLRVGVIGADPSGRGFGARAHVPAVIATPGVKLSAVCTSNPATARQAARRWGLQKWYGDYRELLDDPDIDLVTVAVRVRLHRRIVEESLAAGKMVYCEWPLGLNSHEAASMATLARERGIPCAVGNQGRYSPGIQHAAELLRHGAIGTILSFHATQFLSKFAVEEDRSWLAREDEASGALYVATAHVTDTARFLVGDIEALCGLRETLSPGGQYADTGQPFTWTATDTVAYAARLVGGAFGSVHVTNTAIAPTGFTLDIFGEDGQLTIRSPTYVSFSPARVYRATRFDQVFSQEQLGDDRSTEAEDYTPVNVGRALSEFVKAARTGDRFRPDFDDAYQLHRIVEGIAESSDRLTWVRFADPAGNPTPSAHS